MIWHIWFSNITTMVDLTFIEQITAMIDILVIGQITAMIQPQTNILKWPIRCELTDLNGPRKREKCVFPFIFDKVEYNGCAVDRQDRRRRWCSTKIDRDGVHIDGEEGFCDQDCRYHKPGDYQKLKNPLFGSKI